MQTFICTLLPTLYTFIALQLREEYWSQNAELCEAVGLKVSASMWGHGRLCTSTQRKIKEKLKQTDSIS